MKVILSESTYNLITENPVYMNQSEIPSEIVQWAKDKIGNVRQWKVRQKGEVSVSGAWHESTINYYGIFKLSNGSYIKMKEMEITGWEPVSGSKTIEIPSGFLVAILDSKTSTADIYTSSDALKFLPDTSQANDLSDEQIMALYQSKTLKTNRYKFTDDVYDKLISKGLMAKNRAITTDGRNLIVSLDKDKLKEAADRLNKKFGFYNTFYIY